MFHHNLSVFIYRITKLPSLYCLQIFIICLNYRNINRLHIRCIILTFIGASYKHHLTRFDQLVETITVRNRSEIHFISEEIVSWLQRRTSCQTVQQSRIKKPCWFSKEKNSVILGGNVSSSSWNGAYVTWLES